MTREDLISEHDLIEVFGYSNFGKNSTRRKVLELGLKQVKDGFHTGHTIKCIMVELGLQKKNKQKLTYFGELYLKQND